MYYVEIRPTVLRFGPPRLIPLAELPGTTGFRSVYCYDADTAELIRSTGSTRDLRGTPVYSDTLFVDFDDNPTAALQFAEYLEQQGYAFEQYDSGNRSYHYHVPIEPMFGDYVPKAQKAWARQHAPGADLSFFHPSGQFRLPGTYHPKRPGNCKTLLRAAVGKPLKIDRAVMPAPMLSVHEVTGSLESFYSLLLMKRGPGQRRPHAWLVSVTAAEAGIPFDEAVEAILWWNDTFADPPQDAEELIKQCESAYSRRV